MKITIKAGESVENALVYLEEFLADKKEEYPILAGNMNIYITMKGFGNRICPDNEKEYILSCDGIFNVERGKKADALDNILKKWKVYTDNGQAAVNTAARKIEMDEKYLATAEEKGKRPDLIEKRKVQLRSHQEELQAAEKMLDLLKELDAAIESKKAIPFFLKETKRNKPYDYTLECSIIFKDIGGFTGHFGKNGLRKGYPYGYPTP